jgi:hypothetical protein
MCGGGGAPDPPKKEAPTPSALPELLISKSDAELSGAKSSARKKAAGRGSLVNRSLGAAGGLGGVAPAAPAAKPVRK